MTPEQIEKLKTEIKEAIHACNEAISKLCTIEHSLKDVRVSELKTEAEGFKPQEKTKTNLLTELEHNVTKLQGDQLIDLIKKLKV